METRRNDAFTEIKRETMKTQLIHNSSWNVPRFFFYVDAIDGIYNRTEQTHEER